LREHGEAAQRNCANTERTRGDANTEIADRGTPSANTEMRMETEHTQCARRETMLTQGECAQRSRANTESGR
jgi:hypothetical protein